MLDIRVIKVFHRIEDSRKTSPYIADCHVFSPEAAFATKNEAAEFEFAVEEMYNLGESYGELAYNLTKCGRLFFEYPILFRKKIPVWFLERYEPEQSKKIEQQWNSWNGLNDKADALLAQGRVDEALQLYWQSLESWQSITHLRDEHMGHNLSRAEQRIRERYEINADPLKLVVAVGASHRPEKYATVPVTVIDIASYPTPHAYALKQIEDAYERGSSFEQLKEQLLRTHLHFLAEKEEVQLSPEQLADKTFEELSDLARNSQ